MACTLSCLHWLGNERAASVEVLDAVVVLQMQHAVRTGRKLLIVAAADTEIGVAAFHLYAFGLFAAEVASLLV